MTPVNTRTSHGIAGKRISRFLDYRKARRLCNDISRDISSIEARFLKSRLHHT